MQCRGDIGQSNSRVALGYPGPPTTSKSADLFKMIEDPIKMSEVSEPGK